MAHTFFSIVIVSLNPGQKLMKTLQSVLRQEYGNFEVILKDGGSTDGSLKEEADGSLSVAWLGQSVSDSRVHIFRSPDKGIYDGMNQALVHINGDYVLFLTVETVCMIPECFPESQNGLKRRRESGIRAFGRDPSFFMEISIMKSSGAGLFRTETE